MPEPRAKVLLIATRLYSATLDAHAVITALKETAGKQFPTIPCYVGNLIKRNILNFISK